MKKRILSFVIAIVLILVLVPTALAVDEGDITPLSHPFTDVGDTWYRPYVQFVFDNNIMTGTSATTFAPDSPFSRAMVVATLFRDYHGRRANDNDSRNHPFTDVGNTWYAPYVTWVYNNGIAGGVGGGRFAPHDAVTRQQFATFLFRYADRMTNFPTTVTQGPQWHNFVDRNQIESWALDALTWANYHGFVGGTSATTINPTGTANRAQAAAMITRYVRAANAVDIPDYITIHGIQIPTSATRLSLDRGAIGIDIDNSHTPTYNWERWYELNRPATNQDIQPLRYMVNLYYLAINDNNITDITPLAGLINLRWLSIGNDQGNSDNRHFNNRITDLTPLAGLRNLEQLYARQLPNVDLTGLAGLTNLRTLHVPHSNITDITPLSGLTNLVWLVLWRNDITDLTPLTGMTDLRYLSLLWNDNITDWSPVAHVPYVFGRP